MKAKDARFRNVGAPVERIEDLRLLRGRGQFVDDLHHEGMLHAAVVRSGVAHGRIRAVDSAAARAMPGVHGVFTAADVARFAGGAVPTIPLRIYQQPELVPFEQPVIAHSKVRFVGEPVALVVADTQALAEDAADAVELHIDPLPVVADGAASLQDKVLLFEGKTSNTAITYLAAKGDARAPGAHYVRREKFSVQRHSAVNLEPRGLVAVWDGARTKLTVSGAAKVPFTTRRVLAQRMDLPEDCVEMVAYDVGGGFGVRGEFYPEDFLVPFAARKLNRPVKWIEDRRENLLASNHSRDLSCDIEIACKKDGTILAIRGSIYMDSGAYFRGTGVGVSRNVGQFLCGPYRVPNVHLETAVLMTNKAPLATYRGPGRFEGDFFRERLFDMAAQDLGIDRVEFRRRNLVSKDEMPYPIATVTPNERKEEYDSGDYPIAFERALSEIRWTEKEKLQGQLVDGRYHGLGVGCFVEGGAGGLKEYARLVIEKDASITLYVGSTSVGQGVETISVQIASDALDVPMERIRIRHGSTTLMKEGYGSWHSRSTVMGGSAIVLVADKLKAAVRKAAASRLGCAEDVVTLGEGLSASTHGKSIRLEELALLGLEADGIFENHHHTYAYGSAAAHVAVDPRTGHVQIVDYVAVHDVGRIINPLTATGQAVGGIVQGLGGTLLEHLQYDKNGQFLTASLTDYLLPTASDFPVIRAVMLENSPSPHNPLGAKGGGEGGVVSVGGVVANAVANALSSLDVQPKALPLTPPRIWDLIERASPRRGASS